MSRMGTLTCKFFFSLHNSITCFNRSIPIPERAYHWMDEPFTRLIPGKKNDQQKCQNLLICHHPIKLKFKDVEEYTCIALPLVEDEWFSTSTIFKNVNTIYTARVLSKEIVGKTENDRQVLYAVHIIVPKNRDVWTHGNPSAVNIVTIKWGVRLIIFFLKSKITLV